MRIQRQILCFIFLALYVVTILRPFTPYVNYYLNKEQIAEEKCVNKDKPALECDGKCYLKMQVISMQESDDESPALIDLEVEKYVSVEISSNEQVTNHWIIKQRVIEFTGYNILNRSFSVPEPPPKKQS